MRRDFRNLQPHRIATTKFAVYRDIEPCQIADLFG
jgi:hypothetical protein